MSLADEEDEGARTGMTIASLESPTLGSMAGIRSEMDSDRGGPGPSTLTAMSAHSTTNTSSTGGGGSALGMASADDSYLGNIARWESGPAGSSSSVRTSKMIGRMGMGLGTPPPPPPGPPPAAPPPLPPAIDPAARRGSNPSHSSFSRLSLSSPPQAPAALPPGAQPPPSRRTSIARPTRPPPPAPAPPPTGALPPIPAPVGALPPIPAPSTPPRPKHQRHGSSISNVSASSSSPTQATAAAGAPGTTRRRSLKRLSTSPPTSPRPSISPRTSSLYSSAQPLETPTISPISYEPSSATSSQTMSSLGTPLPNHHLPPSRRDGRQAPRTPSRHLLQSALDLAQRAVEMDKNNDLLGALAAYREAVTRLKSVMERVGVEPERETSRRRNTVGRSEEEGRTLRGIHDAYVARIELLTTYERTAGNASTTHVNQQASASTATLTPDRGSRRVPGASPSSGGDRTPRQSFDETAHLGIGNMMLSNNDDLTSPQRRSPGRNALAEEATPVPAQLREDRERRASITAVKGLNISIPSSAEDDVAETSSLQQAVDLAADEASSSSGPGNAARSSINHLGLGHPSGTPMGIESSSHEHGSPTPSARRRYTADEPSDSMRGSPAQGQDGHLSNGGTWRYNTGIPLTPTSKRTSAQGKNDDAPLPPLPHSAPLLDGNGQPIVTSRHASLTSASFPIRGEREVSVNASTAQGTISRRRSARLPEDQSSSSHGHTHAQGQGSIHSMSELGSEAVSPALTSGVSVSRRSVSSTKSAASFIGQRVRSRSYTREGPGAAGEDDDLPPLPGDQHQRFMQHSSGRTQSGAGSTDYANGLAPPSSAHSHSHAQSHAHSRLSSSSPHSVSRSFRSSLQSVLPEPQPTEIAHRPFHLLRTFHASMDPQGSGAYLTTAIHIPPFIWHPAIFASTRSNGRPAALKIPQQDTKARYIETLLLHLEIVRSAGIPLLDGMREYKYKDGVKLPPGTIALPRAGEGLVLRAAEEFIQALDGLDEEMDQTHKVWSKAGIVTVGWKGQKANTNTKSWGQRITRGVDKITSGKSNDTPEKYVELLGHLCYSIQTINDHLLNFTGPSTPSYHSLPNRTFHAVENRVTRAAEFVAIVVVPFMMDEFKFFFSRYLKGGLKYLEG